MTEKLLEVRNLGTTFSTDRGPLRAVADVSFSMDPGETVCLVGESGCGKSVTSLSIMRLLPDNAENAGEVLFEGVDLLSLGEREMRGVRGNTMSMVFQEPMTSLNPVLKIGDQVIEGVRVHQGLGAKEARAKALAMLEEVGVPRPESMLDEYPHMLSGGQRQRVMIAMALSSRPKLLIADEPTTALDVTIQAQILELMRRLARENGTATILITHDIGVVAEMADRVVMMYAGQVVEETDVVTLFERPRHPYTIGLMKSIPHVTNARDTKLESIPGTVPSLAHMPEVGCRFADRCPFVMDRCRTEDPALEQVDDREHHLVRCFLYDGKSDRSGVDAQSANVSVGAGVAA